MYYFKRPWQLALWLGMNLALALVYVYARAHFHQNPFTGKPSSWGFLVLVVACLANLVFFHTVKRRK